MELMSTLLFCMFVTHVSLALGSSKDHITDQNFKYNYSKKIHRDSNKHKLVLLNLSGPPLVNSNTEVQTVFNDLSCRNCLGCMERAVKAHHSKTRVNSYRPSTEELHNEVLLDLHKDENVRDKRNAHNEVVNKKKIKVKKSKVHKEVTVTKYHVYDEVYALRVKETFTPKPWEQITPPETCQLYIVNNSFPCGTPAGVTHMTDARRKLIKKNQQGKEKIIANVTTIAPQVKTTVIRKRNVDNSHVAESFMPSIEDLY